MRARRRSRTPSSSRGCTRAAPAVIGFEGAFHGRTLLALSLTSKTHPYKVGLGPFSPDVYRVPFPNAYRGPSTAEALAALERAFVTLVAPENVAAIVVEPVQGEGGFIPAPAEFLQGLREICDRHGIVLVVDEVQTGFAAHRPLLRGRALGRRARPDHRCEVDRDGAAALRRAREGRDHGRGARGCGRRNVRRQPGGDRRRSRRSRRDRGRGSGRPRERDRRDHQLPDALLAEPAGRRSATCAGWGRCSRSSSSPIRRRKEPAADLATSVIDAATERGLLLLRAGAYGNCIRVLVPLVIGNAELDEALGVWEDALGAVLQ